MKQEEQKYLEIEKTNSGKTLEQARKEIKILKQSQTDFKVLKKEIKELERKLIKKDKLIDKLQKSHFQNILPRLPSAVKKIKEIKESKNEEATLRELNRIMSLINIEKKIGLADLTKTCMMKSKKMKGALNFLVRNNFIREINERRSLFLEKV